MGSLQLHLINGKLNMVRQWQTTALADTGMRIDGVARLRRCLVLYGRLPLSGGYKVGLVSYQRRGNANLSAIQHSCLCTALNAMSDGTILWLGSHPEPCLSTSFGHDCQVRKYVLGLAPPTV